ncbi:MAG: hypothetical protein H0S80_06955 [Desulfovibrionaceae bacterium]|nr:hypothetical protein [Desulfovibrionaceae bacterium]
MNSRKLLHAAPALLSAAVVFGFGMGAASGNGSADEVRRACNSCHSLKRVCALLGERTEAGWDLSIRNMVARGALVTTGNIKPMARYLAGVEQDDPALCD